MSEQDNIQSPTVAMAMMLDGFLLSQALFVLADAGIATILESEGPQTVAVLAERTGSDADVLARLIRSVTPYGIFRTVGERVAVTELGALLSENHPQSLHGIAVGGMNLHYRPVGELRHTLKTGETAAQKYFGKPYFDQVAADPVSAELFGRAMNSFTKTLRAGMFDGYQLPAGDVVADLGGGDGTVLTELLRSDTRRGIVFDLPGVVESAHPVLDDAGLIDRVDVVAGNFFTEVPTADLYVLSWVLHDWDDEQALEILRTIPAGSRLIVIEQVVPAGDAPHPAKHMDLVMVSLLGGRERTEPEYVALLGNAGFDVERVVPTPSPFVIIESIKR